MVLQEKVEHAKELIREAVAEYGKRVAVGCSWGKDSMAVLYLALQVEPEIPIFSVLTIHKPRETFDFAVEVIKKYNIAPKVYMVAYTVPRVLRQGNVWVRLLPPDTYYREADRIKSESGREIYCENPSLCCQLLKVVPIKEAYRDMELLAWLSGLRNTEGHTRTFLETREIRSEGETKINPILTWTEQEVWEYLEDNEVPIHPWYKKDFPNGKRIRSLGCAPCTVPVYDCESERAGRWKGTPKGAGECGIHTQALI